MRARGLEPPVCTVRTGSSIFILRSTKNTASITSTPATMPMTAAAHGATNAHGAVMATRPASIPLIITPGSGFFEPVYMA